MEGLAAPKDIGVDEQGAEILAETGQVDPTHHFAGRADEVLAARGAIMRGWRTFDNRRDQNRASTGLEPVPAANWRDAGKGSSAGDSPVKVIREWTRPRYDAAAYHIAVMREIENLEYLGVELWGGKTPPGRRTETARVGNFHEWRFGNPSSEREE